MTKYTAELKLSKSQAEIFDEVIQYQRENFLDGADYDTREQLDKELQYDLYDIARGKKSSFMISQKGIFLGLGALEQWDYGRNLNRGEAYYENRIRAVKNKLNAAHRVIKEKRKTK